MDVKKTKLNRINSVGREMNLTGSDKILNLKEISIGYLDSFSSSSCSGRVSFNIECNTNQGYCEDPNFSGIIKVLSVKKDKVKNVYILKIKFEKEKDE